MSRLEAEMHALRMGSNDSRHNYVARPKPDGKWCVVRHARSINVLKGRD